MKRCADSERAGPAGINIDKSVQKWNDKSNKHGEWRTHSAQWSAAAGSFEMCKFITQI